MSFQFGRIPGLDRPIPTSEAPESQWINCWFCDARIRKRNAFGKITHYVTFVGDTHSNVICQRLADSKNILDTDNAVEIFWEAMSKDPKPSAGSGGDGGSNSSSGEGRAVYLKSLADLINYGFFLLPDFKLGNDILLSDILINSQIATAYFSGGPIANLGYRAVVVKPQTFNDEHKWIRYVLDYQAHDGTAKKMYFYQTTTAEAVYDELKQKIFYKKGDGQKYVAKEYPAVIIYGAWVAHGCSWCKRTDIDPGCTNEDGCSGYQYESAYTRGNYLHPISEKMMSSTDRH